jgi:regulatory protein
VSTHPVISADTLIRMATHYLARHSASTAHLRDVLARKIRRRCDARDLPVPDEADIRATIDVAVERLTRTGLLDDQAYARGRARTLAAKGWPAWRIRTELQRQDIDAPAGTLELDETAQARRLAERRRLGPFRSGERPAYRDKDIRSLARAGYPVSIAKVVIDGVGED